MSNNKYWLHGDSKVAISHLTDVREQWSSWNNSPIRQAWIRNYLAYYSPAIAPTSWDTSMIFEGVQGELVRFFTPKARMLIQQKVTLITKQRLAAMCIAQTKGTDILQDVKLGNAVLDQVIQNERLDTKGRVASLLVVGLLKQDGELTKGSRIREVKTVLLFIPVVLILASVLSSMFFTMSVPQSGPT